MTDLNPQRDLRILMVMADLPFPPIGGGPTRNYQLLARLARQHAVSLLAYGAPDAAERVAALRPLCRAVHTVEPEPLSARAKRVKQLASLFSPASYQRLSAYRPAMQHLISRLVAGEHFDVVLVEFSQMTYFDFGSAPVLVLDEHNIDYEKLYRMYQTERSPIRKLYNWIEYLKVRREERRAWKRFDGCSVTSERERAIVNRHRPLGPTVVVPHGVDLDYFRPSDAALEPGTIVFTGSIDYRPNSDAVIDFAQEILPRILRTRQDVTFTIVGREPPAAVRRLAGPHVIVTGAVPDVRPYLRQATIVVVPLRMGSGTRIKLLEAMAMEKAIVTTSIGCEGLDVIHGEHLLVADGPDAFAQASTRLLENASLRAELGRNGRALVETRYSWDRAAATLEGLLSELVQQRRASPPRTGFPPPAPAVAVPRTT
jgi:sugar transferase (PEP-CTERM/EpsH1 system associated)